jgi:multimeric flavodoxin WrbA
MKILAICGSPRKGNTEFMLETALNEIKKHDKELILLREKNLERCSGCLSCDKTKKCIIQDDMQQLYEKLEKADIIVIGTPNYFDNVPGLLKDFIDRTNPYYETSKLKDKKVFVLVVGGGKAKNSQRIVKQAIKYFIKGHKMKLVDWLCLEALHPEDLRKNQEAINKIKEFGQKIDTTK